MATFDELVQARNALETAQNEVEAFYSAVVGELKAQESSAEDRKGMALQFETNPTVEAASMKVQVGLTVFGSTRRSPQKLTSKVHFWRLPSGDWAVSFREHEGAEWSSYDTASTPAAAAGAVLGHFLKRLSSQPGTPATQAPNAW